MLATVCPSSPKPHTTTRLSFSAPSGMGSVSPAPPSATHTLNPLPSLVCLLAVDHTNVLTFRINEDVVAVHFLTLFRGGTLAGSCLGWGQGRWHQRTWNPGLPVRV